MISAALCFGLLQQSTPGFFEPVHDLAGPSGASLGLLLDGGRHLDADGAPDFVAHEGGTIAFYSGTSGALLLRIPAGLPSGYDRLLMMGDTDGDLVSEILLTNFAARQVRVYSGASGTLRYSITGSTFTFGCAAAVIGDVTGDRVADFLLSDPDSKDWSTNGFRGATSLYSGADGTLVRTHQIVDAWSASWAGRRVSQAGDVDRDGVPDYLIGAPFSDQYRGTCSIISGASGGLIRVLANPHPSEGGFGIGVALAGDCDADGVPDQAVITPFVAGGTMPRIAVFAGIDGTLLWEALALQPYSHRFGKTLLGGWDWNGDGMEDLVVSDPDHLSVEGRRGAVHLLSGRDGGVLASRYGELSPTSYAEQLTWLGDQNRDGLPEFGIASPRDDLGTGIAHGRVQSFSWHQGLSSSADTFSAGSGGHVRFLIDLPSNMAGEGYVLLASRTGPGPTPFRGVSVPLTLDALLLRTASSPPRALRGSVGVLDPAGNARVTLTVPPGAASAWIGFDLWFAAVIGSGHALTCSTIARSLTILP